MGAKVSDIITARHNPDWASRTAALLFPSSAVRWPTTEKVSNIWGHLGLLAKTTAVLEMRHFYFQLLSESPLPPVYSSPDPRPPPNCLSCQAYSFKRQMQKLCVDVSVWEWVCGTPGDTKKPMTFSALSISERTQLSGPQLYELHSWLHSPPETPKHTQAFLETLNPQNCNFPHAALNSTEMWRDA